MHSLQQTAGEIGNKTDYQCFKQRVATSSQRGKLLKFIDQFMYLSSNISFIESDVNIPQGKAWNVIDRLSIIWKSYLTDKRKQDFFQAVAVSILLNGGTTLTQTKLTEKKLGGNYPRILA